MGNFVLDIVGSHGADYAIMKNTMRARTLSLFFEETPRPNQPLGRQCVCVFPTPSRIARLRKGGSVTRNEPSRTIALLGLFFLQWSVSVLG